MNLSPAPYPDADLDSLAAAIATTTKYRHVSPELIKQIGAKELSKGRKLRDAIKATKSKLHQVGGAYLPARPNYAQFIPELRRLAVQGDEPSYRLLCRQVMARHTSTRERLSILDDFYATVLAGLPPIHSVMDVACGLNPLAVSWMPLEATATYYAYDIYADMMGFLTDFFSLAGIAGSAAVRDVLSDPPRSSVDLVLILKSLPCLEQLAKDAVHRLLNGLRASYLLISYPIHSLGGRDKGMLDHYESHFGEIARNRGWQVKRFEFETELAFLAETGVTLP